MTVAVRVIPCLDVDAGRVVKGVNFRDLRDAGDPVELAAAYDAEGADELVFLDITASSGGRDTMIDVVGRTADQVFIPLTVGGGVRSVADVDRLLRAGADKVSLNTAAIARPELLAEAAQRFGSQCVVLSVDARRVADGAAETDVTGEADGDGVGGPGGRAGEDGVRGPEGAAGGDGVGGPGSVPSVLGGPAGPGDGASRPARFEVTTHGGRRGTGIDAIEWAARGAELGVGEILLNSMDADGTKAGFDLELILAVRAVVDVPVIASGGAGELAHFAPAVGAGADAVLAASVFHFGQLRISEVKDALRGAGYPVR
jgi:cyclase